MSPTGFSQGSNVKTFKALQVAYRHVQMLWDSVSPHHFNPDEMNSPATAILLHISMGIACTKLLRPKGRIASLRALAWQRDVLRNELDRNVKAIRDICSLGRLPYIFELSHPFAECVAGIFHQYDEDPVESLDRLIEKCHDAEYKKQEAVFIRVSNDERKKIRDALRNCLEKNKKVYMLRYDIFTSKELTFGDYREQLGGFIEKLDVISRGGLLLAVDVISPRVWNFNVTNTSKGQLVV